MAAVSGLPISVFMTYFILSLAAVLHLQNCKNTKKMAAVFCLPVGIFIIFYFMLSLAATIYMYVCMIFFLINPNLCIHVIAYMNYLFFFLNINTIYILNSEFHSYIKCTIHINILKSNT